MSARGSLSVVSSAERGRAGVEGRARAAAARRAESRLSGVYRELEKSGLQHDRALLMGALGAACGACRTPIQAALADNTGEGRAAMDLACYFAISSLGFSAHRVETVSIFGRSKQQVLRGAGKIRDRMEDCDAFEAMVDAIDLVLASVRDGAA